MFWPTCLVDLDFFSKPRQTSSKKFWKLGPEREKSAKGWRWRSGVAGSGTGRSGEVDDQRKVCRCVVDCPQLQSRRVHA
jgi:hypothetical protein